MSRTESSRRGARAGTPVILGVPFDGNSSYLRGAAGAPGVIRAAMQSSASNSWAECGVDVAGAYQDAGDVQLGQDAITSIEQAVGDLLDRGLRPICLGGDHSITVPILRAFGKRNPDFTVVHFDAHPDLYDELDGNRMSHACPFARVLEEKMAKQLVQLGIRTLNGHQREQAARFGVEIIQMQDLPALEEMKVQGRVYISFDIDVLDPAFAPGISHREPGGMSVREGLAHLQAISGKIIGADLVEFNPAQDVSNVTATVAAKLLKELLGKMLSDN